MDTLKLDDFQLQETLGVGTVGTIFRAIYQKDGRAYALKLLNPAVSNAPLIVERFQREMLILSKLSHPNIVAYLGSGKHDGQLFYVMELIEGDTLKHVLEQSGPFSWQEAAECGRQIAAGLQHAHNHGIIHRDLKPSNVYLSEEGQLKIGDFGIAKDLTETDITDAGMTVGTYLYMAPELIRGEKEITGQIDLYALGCLLFELLSGQPPYPGDNFAAIFEQHLHAPPPSLRQRGVSCPPELETLIVRLLAKDPNDRPFNAREVQGVLTELLTARSLDPSLTVDDQAAASVVPVRATLAERLRLTRTTRDVPWWKVSALCIALTVAIGLMILFAAD